MKLIGLIFLLIMMASPTFAADTSDGVMNYDLTEYFYQAPAGRLVVSLNPYVLRSFGVGDFSTQTTSGNILGFGLEYGFNKNFSLSVSDDIGSSTYTSDHDGYTQTGTSNIVVQGKANFDLSASDKLTAAVTVSLTPDKSDETNRYLGEDDLTAQIGYQNKLSQNSLLGFAFNTTASIPDSDYNSKTTYSSGLVASYEMTNSTNKFGGELAVTHAYTGADFSTLVGLDIYANFAVTNAFSIGPGLLYDTFTDAIFHKDGVEQFDILKFQIIARYAF